MIVIPAIDLKGGRCVRLLHGDMNKETVYSDHPADMAGKWKSLGARRLHVVDLDGAVTGELKNLEQVRLIKEKTGLEIQMGGGIRNEAAADKVFSVGVDRAILGTVIFSDFPLAQKIFKKYPGKMTVALDAKDGFVAVKGWTDSSGVTVEDAFSRIRDLGADEVVYTDINRDGALTGVNVEAIKKAKETSGLSIIASAGVKSIEDIKALLNINAFGCVVGKSIYEGTLDLKEAFDLVNAHVG